MSVPASRAPINPTLDPFLVSLRVEGGVARVNVEGDVDGTSVPLLLQEIRHAAGMIEELVIMDADEAEARRRLELDLTEVDRLETHAAEEIMVLVHELEADDVAIGIAR
jgi:hypothetical protein